MPANTASKIPTTEDLEGISHRLKMDYVHRNGLRELRKVVCACRVIGSRKCMGRKVVGDCQSPRSDHSATFKVIETGALVMVEQPYVGDATDVAALTAACEAFAKEFGLTVRVSAESSWHYPGATCLVEYRKAVRS